MSKDTTGNAGSETWQPIKTAPRDSTEILGVQFRKYPGDGKKFPIGSTMQWEGGIASGWWAYTGLTVFPVPTEESPTHWLPLPDPPTTETPNE